MGWAAAPHRPSRFDLVWLTWFDSPAYSTEKNPKLLLICKHIECRRIMSQTLNPSLQCHSWFIFPPPAPPTGHWLFWSKSQMSFHLLSISACISRDKVSFKNLQIYIIALSLLKIVIIFNVIKYPIGIHLCLFVLGFLFSAYLNRESNKATGCDVDMALKLLYSTVQVLLHFFLCFLFVL